MNAHSADSHGSQRARIALTIVGVYAAFSALWILVSDSVSAWLFVTPEAMALASVLKGWVFVAVTSLLLYGLLRRWAGTTMGTHRSASQEAAAEELGAGDTAPDRTYALPAVLIGVAIMVLGAAGIAYLKQHRSGETGMLQAIADLKTSQIGDWLEERQRAAEFIQTSSFLSQQFVRWQAGDAGAGEVLKQRLALFAQNMGFSGATLLDGDMQTVWRSGLAPEQVSGPLWTAIESARQQARVVRVGPYPGVRGNPRLDYAVPLGGTTIALHIDPTAWLYARLQAWPLPTETGETMLVRREGQRVLHLSALRFRPDAALNLIEPLAAADLPDARALRGEADSNGIVAGVDYRGEAVVAAVRAVPGTDWLLLAKMDARELNRKAWQDMAWLGLSGLLALGMVGFGLMLMRQRQRHDLAVARLNEQAGRLRALQLLDAIAENSQDAIFAKDAAGRYILFNRAAERFTGKPASAVIGHADGDVFPPAVAQAIAKADAQIKVTNAPCRFEEEYARAEEGALTVEVTKMPLYDQTGQWIGLFGIARDISERKRMEMALRDSEQRFHEIFNNMSSGVAVYEAVDGGRDFVFKDFNPAAERIERIARDEVIGRRLTAVFPGVVAFGLLDVLYRVWRTGEPESFPIRHYEDERIAGWRENHVCHLASGEVVAIYDDITEQKRAEAELIQSEVRFHDIVEASADWIWEVDAKGRYTYASESVAKLLGYSPAEVIGRTPFDFMPPGEADRVRAEFAAIATSKAAFRDLYNITVHKDGSLHHVWSNGMPIIGANGELRGYRGLDRDITEMKRAERELLETRDQLHALVNTIPDLIWLKDAEGRYLACNHRFEQLFGASETEILGKTDHDFVPCELADFFRAKDLAVIEAGEPRENEEELTFASDGHREILLTIKTPFHGRDGRLVGVLGIARDITERKAAEAELKARNDELERFNRATVGRELDMLEMKKTINALSRELGREPPYALAFLKDGEGAGAP